jgi:hypothetical protein
MEFLSPGIEGTHTVSIYADKEPFVRGEKSDSFEVKKTRSVSIIFPDVIRVAPGKNLTRDIVIMNIGQDDIMDLSVDITGVPYPFKMDKEKASAAANSQDKIQVTFFAPKDAPEATASASIKVHTEGFSKEKTFGFTIEKELQTSKQAPATGLLPGFALPSISLQIPQIGSFAYVILFGASSFSAALLLKKLKTRRERHRHMSMLFDIKNHIKSREKKPKN